MSCQKGEIPDCVEPTTQTSRCILVMESSWRLKYSPNLTDDGVQPTIQLIVGFARGVEPSAQRVVKLCWWSRVDDPNTRDMVLRESSRRLKGVRQKQKLADGIDPTTQKARLNLPMDSSRQPNWVMGAESVHTERQIFPHIYSAIQGRSNLESNQRLGSCYTASDTSIHYWSMLCMKQSSVDTCSLGVPRIHTAFFLRHYCPNTQKYRVDQEH